MITLQGEITEITCPPNQADQFRSVSVWIPDTEEHMEFTFVLSECQRSGFAEGDKITIKVEKQFDIDSLTRNLFKGS